MMTEKRASTPKPTAPVKAWAVVAESGTIYEHNEHDTLAVFAHEEAAEKYHWKGERVIPVLITPLTSEAHGANESQCWNCKRGACTKCSGGDCECETCHDLSSGRGDGSR